MADHEVTPGTRFSADLKTVVAMLGTIIAGSVIAGGTYVKMTLAYEKLEQSQKQLALSLVTKADLLEERKHTEKTVRSALGQVRVKCPRYVIKGQTHVICEIVNSDEWRDDQ